MAAAKTMTSTPAPVVDPHADRRKRLEELRDDLAEALREAKRSKNLNMLPQLAGQYRATLKDLDELPVVVKGAQTVRDQLKERRESKISGAPDRGSTPAPAPAAAAKGRKRRA